MFLILTVCLAACGGDEPTDENAVRGVDDTTIRLGMHTDLSGVLATWGVPNANGLRMRFEEQNAAGGIHGRMIELIVEDSQYQVPLAVKATNKLINVDKVFAMVGAMGTPHNNAAFSSMFADNIPSLFPATAAVSMAEPLHPLKFSYFLSYRDQARLAIRYLVEQNGFEKVCLQRIATDYGEEVEIGFHSAAEELTLDVVYVGRHKASETDFVGTVAGIKNSGCELLVLGPFIKDAIQLYTAARDSGWAGTVVGNMVSYVPEVSGAGGGKMDGLYSAASFLVPNFEADVEPDPWIGQWSDRYRERFGTEPVGQAVITYGIAELVIQGLQTAGRDLTVDGLVAGLESITNYRTRFGGPSYSLSASKHFAADSMNLYQVENGHWELVVENIAIDGAD